MRIASLVRVPRLIWWVWRGRFTAAGHNTCCLTPAQETCAAALRTFAALEPRD